VDISLVVVNASYPILDAIVIFPIALMFWGVRRISSRHKNTAPEEKESNEKGKSPSFIFVSGTTSIWVLLLLVAMVLSAAGDSGFAYTSAFDVTTVQNYIWIWNILYNSDHLCLAAALIGYRHFFSFNKIDTLQH
jgi:ABC-type Fe3+ transport system permease subunit